MPNIKAAIKWVKQSEKRQARNLATKTKLKTIFKKAKAAGDVAQGRGVESQLDKAAGKGVIHPNKAARKKSRLAKALSKPVAVAAKPKTAAKKAK